MSYKTFVSMNIAVIGVGEQIENFAVGYALAGHEVFIAWNNGNAGSHSVVEVCDNINVCSIEEAADMADVIIIASAPKDVREIAYWLGDVRGKVIIDATANFNSRPEDCMNTFGAIKSITGSSYIVKAFCTRGYEQLLKPLLKKDDAQWIMVGDSKKAKEVTKILAKDMGVTGFLDMGGSDAVTLFDATTKCWRELAALQPKKAVKSTR